jgi:hypothetical protein
VYTHTHKAHLCPTLHVEHLHLLEVPIRTNAFGNLVRPGTKGSTCVALISLCQIVYPVPCYILYIA